MTAEAITIGYLTGKTVKVAVRRDSDGAWLDFSDGTFKAAGWTTGQQAMTEVTTGMPTGTVGHYRTTVDPAAWTAGDYQLEVYDAAIATQPIGAAAIQVHGGTITADRGIKAKTDALPSGVQKNAALAGFAFPMFDASDGRTPKTGLTVTGQRSLDGGAFTALTNAVAELANGLYKVDLAASDLNGNVVVLRFTATGADATILTILTEPATA